MWNSHNSPIILNKMGRLLISSGELLQYKRCIKVAMFRSWRVCEDYSISQWYLWDHYPGDKTDQESTYNSTVSSSGKILSLAHSKFWVKMSQSLKETLLLRYNLSMIYLFILKIFCNIDILILEVSTSSVISSCWKCLFWSTKLKTGSPT